METLDGWAMSIGDSSCRYLGRHGHDGLQGLFCSDGAYSAGWRVVIAILVILILAFVLVRMFRTA